MRIKSQLSIEFLLIVGFLFIFFAGAMIYFFEIRSSYVDKKGYLDSRAECLRFADIVTEVYVGGSGIEVEAYSSYNITFFNYSLISVVSEDGEAICTFYANVPTTSEVTGDIIIKNIDETVVINGTAA